MNFITQSFILDLNRKFLKILRGEYFLWSISLERVVVPSPPKIVITFPGSIRSYPVKDNYIGSAVSEILRYKQTEKQTNILLLYYKDNLAGEGDDIAQWYHIDLK